MIVLDSSFLLAFHNSEDVSHARAAFETFRSEGRAALSFADAAIATLARRDASGCVATFDSDFRELDGVSVVP